MEYRNSTRDNSHLVPSTIQSDGSLCIERIVGGAGVGRGALYCTCRRGRPCTSSPSLPRPRDTFCRCGGCSRRRLRPSSRTFPGASGSGRKSARRTAGWNSWLLAVEAPGARSSSSWGDDKAFLNYFSPPPPTKKTLKPGTCSSGEAGGVGASSGKVVGKILNVEKVDKKGAWPLDEPMLRGWFVKRDLCFFPPKGRRVVKVIA